MFETPTRHHMDAAGGALGTWIPARGEGDVFLNESPLLVWLHLTILLSVKRLEAAGNCRS